MHHRTASCLLDCVTAVKIQDANIRNPRGVYAVFLELTDERVPNLSQLFR